MKGAHAGSEGLVVEPGRIFQIIEEVAHRLRGIAKGVVVLVDARLDEPVQFLRRRGRDVIHYRIERRVADGGVSDIVVRKRLIVLACFRVAVYI